MLAINIDAIVMLITLLLNFLLILDINPPVCHDNNKAHLAT